MVEKVADGVWHIDCQTRDKPNVYLVDDDELTLVDAGWPADAETIRDGISTAGFDLGDVGRVLLTHYDIDHVGSLGRLTPDLDAPLFVHHWDAPYVAGEQLPPWTARHGIEAIHRLLYRRLDLPALPVHRVDDSDTVGGFEVSHTPGHTPGHVAYVHDGHDAVFLGDLAVGWGDSLRVADRITSYDRSEAKASARKLLARITEFEHACPGHGPTVTDGYETLRRAVE